MLKLIFQCALIALALASVSCAPSSFTARALHSDTEQPISGIAVSVTEATGQKTLNGWPAMKLIDRGVQIPDKRGECTFSVEDPGYCSVFPVQLMDFDFSNKPDDYIEEGTGVYVFFLRPQNH